MHYPFYIFVDLVCSYFIKDFGVYVDERYWFLVFFACNLSVWLGRLARWPWPHRMCRDAFPLLLFPGIGIVSFLSYFMEFTNKITWAFYFLFWKMLKYWFNALVDRGLFWLFIPLVCVWRACVFQGISPLLLNHQIFGE